LLYNAAVGALSFVTPYYNCLDSIGGLLGEAIESLSTLDPLLVDGPEQSMWGGKWCSMKLVAIIIRGMWSCYRGLYVPEDE
jgi:hypothetical protein